MDLQDLINLYYNKFITWDEARQMRHAKGYNLADLHGHSFFSYDMPNERKYAPHRIAKKAKREGYDFIGITDHDTDLAWQKIKKHKNWIRGLELTFSDNRINHSFELNILNYSDEVLEKILDSRRNAGSAVNEALKGGATVIANHPWHLPYGGSYDRENYWSLVNDFKLPIELNHSRNWVENLVTYCYAEYYGLPLVASSDNHTSTPSYIATVARGKTVDDFLDNVSKGDSYLVFSSLGWMGQPQMCINYMSEILDSEGQTYRGPGRDGIDRLIYKAESFIKNNFPKKSGMRTAAQYTVYTVLGVGAIFYYPFECLESIKRFAL